MKNIAIKPKNSVKKAFVVFVVLWFLIIEKKQFGTESESEGFFLTLSTSNLKGVFKFNQLEFKSGVT